MAGSERFASGLLPYLHHHPAALSKLSLILHCYFPNRFSANFRQILLFSSLFVHQYFPGTSTSSSDSPLSLLRCFSPRNPPINAKKTQGFLPWVSFIPFFVAELVHFSREENIEIQTNYSCVCIVPYSTQKDKNICSRIIRKAWNRIPGIVALTVSTSVGTSP